MAPQLSFSTCQCEGAEAGREAGDWTTQSETEDKQDAEDEEEEEEVKMFYPGWYKPSSRCSPMPADSQLKLQDAKQTICSAPPQSPCSQSQPQPLKTPAVTPVPQLRPTQQEAAGEEEDMQGWVCLPGAADRSVGRFGAGDGSAANSDSPSSKPPAETCSGLERGRSETDEDNVKLSDGGLEGAEEKEQHDEDDLNLKQRESGEFEDEMPNERRETGLEREAESTREDRSEGKRDVVDDDDDDDDDAESLGDGDSEFEASGFAEKKEDGERNEIEGKTTSSNSLQVSVVRFYLRRHHHHHPAPPHPPADVASPPYCLLLLLAAHVFETFLAEAASPPHHVSVSSSLLLLCLTTELLISSLCPLSPPFPIRHSFPPS